MKMRGQGSWRVGSVEPQYHGEAEVAFWPEGQSVTLVEGNGGSLSDQGTLRLTAAVHVDPCGASVHADRQRITLQVEVPCISRD